MMAPSPMVSMVPPVMMPGVPPVTGIPLPPTYGGQEEQEEEVSEERKQRRKERKEAKDRKNKLELSGNMETMNLSDLILNNILGSTYFKGLFKLKTYHEVVDEIYYSVEHLEPWMPHSKMASQAWCLLYKCFTLKLTRKQMIGMLDHTDSPYVSGSRLIFTGGSGASLIRQLEYRGRDNYSIQRQSDNDGLFCRGPVNYKQIRRYRLASLSCCSSEGDKR